MLIIKDGVKRTVNLPFQIALSVEEAEAIVTQLRHAIKDSPWWVYTEIHPPMQHDGRLDQGMPLAWTDPGNVNKPVVSAPQKKGADEYRLDPINAEVEWAPDEVWQAWMDTKPA